MLTQSIATVETNGKQNPRVEERPDHWPRDILEAYAWGQGPYTVDNANTILEREQLYFTNHTQIVWDVDEANQEIWVYRAES